MEQGLESGFLIPGQSFCFHQWFSKLRCSRVTWGPCENTDAQHPLESLIQQVWTGAENLHADQLLLGDAEAVGSEVTL